MHTSITQFASWARGFFEQDAPPSMARLIILLSFLVGTILAFCKYDFAVVALFIVQGAFATAFRTQNHPGKEPPVPGTVKTETLTAASTTVTATKAPKAHK